MKMKKMLSLAVVLAMALAVMPMFGISVSAQELTTVAKQVGADTVVWTMPENTWGEGPVSAAVFGDGWSSSGQLLVENDALILGRNKNTGELTSPGYACGADTIVVEMNWSRSTGFNKSFVYRLGFVDVDGTECGHAWLADNKQGESDENPWGFKSGEFNVALVIKNDYENSKHTNYWYTNGDLKITSKSLEGTVNGFGGINVTSPSYGYGNDTSKIVKFTNLTISAKYPETQNERTVKGALDDIFVAKLAKNKVELPKTTTDGTKTEITNITWTSSNPEIVNEEGEVVKASNKTVAVELTPSCEFDGKTIKGNPKTVNVFPVSLAGSRYEHEGTGYKVGEENLLGEKLNTDFSNDDEGELWNKGWTGGSSSGNPGTELSTDKFANLTEGDVSYIKAKTNDGSTAAGAIVTTVSDLLETNSEYIVSFMVNDLPDNGVLAQWRRIFNNAAASGTPICSGITALNGWERKVYYFKATDASLRIQFSYLASSGEFTDFAVYELTPLSESAPQVAPVASLGWDNGKFTLDFALTDDSNADGITVYGADKDGSFEGTNIEYIGHQEITDGTDGVMLKTGASNRIYKAVATSDNGNIEGAESEPVSLYQLVVDDIAENAEAYKGDQKEHLDAAKVAAANAVIVAGGVYYDGENALTTEGAKLFNTPNVSGDTVTVEIKDDIKGFGIGFVLTNDSKLYFGSAGTEATVSNTDGAGKVFYKLTITKDVEGKYTVTLGDAVDAVGLEAVTLSLDSVNIEFVETLITEIEVGGIDAETDFIPEI